MNLNCVKLGCTVTFIKYLAREVYLMFPLETLIWNKIMFLASKFLAEFCRLVGNEVIKSIL